jgi:poly(3-hydroxybutyrate) depolymerase
MSRIDRRTNLALLTAGLLLAAVNVSCGRPVITAQPQDQTNILGTTAIFTVGAIGTPEPAYQWQKLDGSWTNLTDRTNTTLVLTNVQTSDEADYRAVVTNTAGATNSAAAHLYVIVPPSNLVLASDQVVIAGANPSFTAVVFTGTWLSYQWYRDGVALSGATNATLAFPNVQPTNAGAYNVLVTNLGGAVTSQLSQLSVAGGWVFTNAQGTQLPYRLFQPPRNDPATNYPLVLFWHGAGEVGTDNVGQMKDNGQFSFLTASNLAKFPCFYLAPQLPYQPSTCEQEYAFLDCATNLLSYLESQFAINPDRIYVTGLSMGGFLSWIMAARFPELLAAAVPMSGGWVCNSFQDLPFGWRVPVWNFHAANDGTIGVSYSDASVAALRVSGANVLYTRYQSGGHGIWPTAYKTPVLVDWVMAQRRGVTRTNEPLLTITSPTPEAVWRTGVTNLNLTGTAAALGQAVTLVSWTNLANSVKGTAVGSNAWTVTNIPVVAGQTNLIIVTAATTSWAPTYRGNTTFNDTLTVVSHPIQVTLVLQGTEAILNWTGDGPPYRVQRATDLVVGDWTDFLTNVTPPVSVPVTGQFGFYRVVGQ